MSEKLNNGHSDRILVVDDSAANLQLLTNLLTSQGYTVYPASDGELALEFVRSTLPDLILLDIRMPEIDGFEVCRRLKADERTSAIPIIFISGLVSEHDKVRGFQAGALDYITKPFQYDEVLARVRTHLNLRELTEHLEQKVAERTEELHAANAQLQRELADRQQAEAALRQSETLLNATQQLAKIGGWEWDVDQQTIFWTEETYRIHGFEPLAFESGSSEVIDRSLTCYDPVDRPVILTAFQRCAQQGEGYDLEFPFTSADGCRKWIRTTGAAVCENDRIVKVVGNIVDITERKQAEVERQAQFQFFEGMDQINRAIHGANDLEQMMSDVLNVVLSTLACDRAFLLYPCDPEAETWSIPMERNRPEYPGVGALGIEMAMNPAVAETFRILIAADGPVKFGPGTSHAVPQDVAERFGVKCFLSMIIYPKVGKPWQFGIHQCSHARIWTLEEERLFKEIGRRLADSMSSLLMCRVLQESEQRYRMVFENSPVSIWEEDFSEVHIFFDRLKKEGITDIEQYLDHHPNMVRHCAELAKITDVNRAALTLHGAVNKEELFAGLVNTFTPESFDTFRQELVCLWKGGTEMVRDAVVKTLAGESRHVTVYFSICPGYEKTLAKVIVSLVDISSHKQAEELLRAREDEFRAVVENAPDVIVRYDREGRRIFVNPEFERINHISAREVIGKKPTEISTELAPKAVEFTDKLMAAMESGMKTTIDLSWTKDGRTQCWYVRVVPEFDAAGAVVSALTIWSDLSERKQIEEQIRKLNEELELRVQQRTTEIEEKNTELIRMNRLFVGRELRMVELKERIRELENQTREPKNESGHDV